MALHDLHDRVQRLRLHASRGDARLRLFESLAQVEALHPPELPADAILLIRRLALRWDAGHAPTARAAALLRSVAGTVADAARPALGPVPAGAEVVLFESRAELLACLALDALAGHHAWWWSLLGLVPDHFADAWLEEPAVAPAVVEFLAGRGRLHPVLAQIRASEGRQLCRALIERFALPALLEPLARLRDVEASRVEDGPWTPWSGAWSHSAVSAPVALFAGAALGLQRAESMVRSSSFATAVGAWVDVVSLVGVEEPPRRWAASSRSPTTPSTPAQPGAAPLGLGDRIVIDSRVPGERAQDASEPRRTKEEATSVEPARPSPRSSGSTTGPMPGPPNAEESRPGPASLAPRGEDPVPLDIAREPPPTPKRPREHPLDGTRSGSWTESRPPAPVVPLESPSDRGALHDRHSKEERPDTDEPTAAPAAITTALGGGFYLINLALALDLYGDFTQPLHPGCGLPPWDVVAELTARLLDAPAPIDPLWGLLAALAGRPRLVPADDDPRDGAPGDFAPPGHRWPRTRSEAWFADLERRARDRLASAIGLPASTWLRQRADVHLGEARLDIHFSLADHPIEVRLAGLDRDPGWVPATGRTLRFWYHS